MFSMGVNLGCVASLSFNLRLKRGKELWMLIWLGFD